MFPFSLCYISILENMEGSPSKQKHSNILVSYLLSRLVLHKACNEIRIIHTELFFELLCGFDQAIMTESALRIFKQSNI